MFIIPGTIDHATGSLNPDRDWLRGTNDLKLRSTDHILGWRYGSNPGTQLIHFIQEKGSSWHILRGPFCIGLIWRGTKIIVVWEKNTRLGTFAHTTFIHRSTFWNHPQLGHRNALTFYWYWPGEGLAILISLRHWHPWHVTAHINNMYSLKTSSAYHPWLFNYFSSPLIRTHQSSNYLLSIPNSSQ